MLFIKLSLLPIIFVIFSENCVYGDISCRLPTIRNGRLTRFNTIATDFVEGGAMIKLRCHIGYRVVDGASSTYCVEGNKLQPSLGRCSLRGIHPTRRPVGPLLKTKTTSQPTTTLNSCNGFTCKNNNCIPTSYLCDGEDDCDDGTDELNCTLTTTKANDQCLSGFRCANSWQQRCIPRSYICDGDNDCGDYSDERNCTQDVCHGFQCQNHKCVPLAYLCDLDNDCGDGSDEAHCTVTQPITTAPCSGFRCDNGRCIRSSWVCDFDNDCRDNSDERNCNCTGFKCSNDKCIRSTWKCDGDNDCGDNSDESSCLTCPNAFKCATINKCIRSTYLCDGDNDCDDRSDESNCSSRTTAPTTPRCTGFECNNLRCIRSSWRCDGDNDCGDRSDEQNCPTTTTTLQPCTGFRCTNSYRCIRFSWICDGDNDCGDNSDETNCSLTTTTQKTCSGFLCGNGRRCIRSAWVCDGDNDCGDMTDERNCTTTTPRCSGFACNNGKCIRGSWQCDGDNDCGDNSDEHNCPSTPQPRCVGFTCDNGRCTRSSYICDGDNDCGDWSDERNCQNTTPRPCEGFRCRNGRCIRRNWMCDGDNDCGDGSDENACPGRQQTTKTPCKGFQCADGKCLTSGYQCDGERDCHDGSDERNCTETVTGGPLTFNKCGALRPNTRIFGGSTSMAGEFPWVVKLYSSFVSDSGLYGCDATLISSQWVLTAAHCVSHKTTVRSIKILLGRYNLELRTRSEHGLEKYSSQVIVHPHYDRTNDWNNDFALIKMSSPIAFQKNIRPLCLPGPICDNSTEYTATTIDSCTELHVAGWGRTEQENSPSTLRMGVMPIQSRRVCNRYFGSTLSDSQMCVGRGSPSTCKGDSGGPVMCLNNNRFYAIGVISWGSATCGRPGAPSVFSRVCKVMPWIEQHVGPLN